MIKKQTSKPKCIVVTGRPGAGKTTLARKLAALLWLPFVSRDELKEGYVNTFGIKHDQLPPNTNGVVSDFFFETIEHYLKNNVSLVVEAALQHPAWVNLMARVGDVCQLYFVVCSIDAETAAQRHLQRGLDQPEREFYHGDKRVSIFRETGKFEPGGEYLEPQLDAPTIRVSTLDDYEPPLEEIVGIIRS